MSTELIINASLPETRIVLLENGEIQDLLIERAQGKGIVGNIYKGRVTRVLPGMQAAFVDIGLEKAAFLYVDDVYVHSEIWEMEEGEEPRSVSAQVTAARRAAGAEEPMSAGVAPEGAAGQGSAGVRLAHAAPEGGEGNLDAAAAAAAGAIVDEALASHEREPIQEARGEAQEEELEEEFDEDDHVYEPDDTMPHRLAHDVGLEEEDEDEDEDEEELDELEEGDEDLEEGQDEDSDESEDESEDDDEDEDDDHGRERMGPDPDDSSGGSDDRPPGTVAPHSDEGRSQERQDSGEAQAGAPREQGSGGEGERSAGAQGEEGGRSGGRRRHRRGRRGGKFRKRPGEEGEAKTQGQEQPAGQGEGGEEFPESFGDQMSEQSEGASDRSAMADQVGKEASSAAADERNRPENTGGSAAPEVRRGPDGNRDAFQAQRGRDRRIKSRSSGQKSVRGQVNIQDLLKEGQEVIVQVAKDPIATKGARLTCHISLPGRHLVCMPTIDHVGVSRRIERDEERRRLREYVERYRPRNLGFIVRTASGRSQSEKRIKQDIEYLTRLWNEIREKAADVTAPALVYEDLNSVLRAIRDWVTEDIDKIIVDSRYHYNDILRFCSHFMPSLKQKVELYHGDVPIFDAYNISTELSRGLERKVWLKSGGYLVIDQAEALVAIDVNTGRYVGKKNLEDTILKTNLEAVQEIAYQLRLRNCGGIIILDLIDMEKEENKQRVYRALEEAIKNDRARPTILKISELGLVEMTRKRTRDTMVRALCESCTHCEGKGFVKSKHTVAYEILREIERVGINPDVTKILVQAHADAIDILAIDERETLDQLERRYRKQIYLQAVTDFHPEQFEITGDQREGTVRVSLRTGRDRESRDRDEERGGRRRDRGRNRSSGSGSGRGRSSEAGSGRSGAGSGGDRDRDRDRGGRSDRQERGGRRDRGRGRDEGRNQGIAPVQASDLGAPESSRNESDEPGSSRESGRGPRSRRREEPGGGHSEEQRGASHAGGGEDEDRLAFLRAQAAQDAALAVRSSGAEEGDSASERQERQGGEGDRPGRRGRRGRRGGAKYRRDEKGQGGTRPGIAAGRGPVVPGEREGSGEGGDPAPRESREPAGSSGGSEKRDRGDSGEGRTGDSGGGSDHSQPPT